MRYIDHTGIQLPNGWLSRAEAATKAVANGAEPGDHADVWQELKPNLAELFYCKCWYCESPVDRSDNAVDHFRPKGRVKEAPTHLGYRWLAFDQFNYRFACTFCNSRRRGVVHNTSGGKSDSFPLLDEDQRVYSDGPVDAEQPMLLDPCDVDDWRLLGCQKENGRPCPASTDPESVEYQRAMISIESYHLHYEPTCKRRHLEILSLLCDIQDAKNFFKAAQSDSSQNAAFKKVAQRILKAIARCSPYSGDMRFLLGGERESQHPWIQKLLET